MKLKLLNKKFLMGLALLTSLVWLAVFSFPDNKLRLVFCDVGQGDATLITKGFTQILIDGGPNDKVLTCLRNNLPLFDRKIEIVALTHPEADHLTGLVSVLKKYEVEYFLSGPEGNNSAIFVELSSKLKVQSEKLRLRSPYSGEKININNVNLDILWPEREWVASKLSNCELSNCELGSNVLGMKTKQSLNDFSLVFLMQYKEKKVLLMGDADKGVQNEILAISHQPLAISDVDILKFPHHGSKTGMTSEFLEKIKPKEAVISVGKNSFGHPTTEALEMLQKAGVKIRRTDLEGEIKYTF